ncbi:MAG: leucine-rich repeat domain-containing protein [Oscillospiraceae bacterium]|nr:leucine-rich repeat domain-containing protein [Oscillospiraceae bacterium]
MKLRKFGAAALAAAMAAALVPATAIMAFAEDFIIDGEGRYIANGLRLRKLDDGTLSVMELVDKTLTEVTVPEEVDGKKVTEIQNSVFRLNESLISVTIPDSVTSIGNEAFKKCTSLENVTIGSGVTKIGWSAFNGCTNLTSITIPDSVTSIGSGAFYNTPWLESKREENPLVIINNVLYDGTTCIGDVVIPNCVTLIGESAFSGCESLTSVTIPDSVTEIGDYAFGFCTYLTNVTISDGVNLISVCAFRSCENLKSITIPDSVTKIDNYAFEGCTSLAEIIIPNSITTINVGTFSDCTSLKSVSFPDSLIAIHRNAFDNTLWLESEQEKNPLVTAGKVLYDGTNCTGDVIVPDDIVSISGAAFMNSTGIERITIPDSVIYLASMFGSEAIENLSDVYYTGTEEQWNEINFFFTSKWGGEYGEYYIYKMGGGELWQDVTPKKYLFGDAEIHYNYAPKTPEDRIEYIDEATKITAAAEEGAFESGTELVVAALADKTDENNFTFDISFKKDGNEVQPNGYVTVRIPVPDALAGKTIYVYRAEADGSYTNMNAKLTDDGYIEFKTNHFSEYIVTSEPIYDDNDDDDDDISTRNSTDTSTDNNNFGTVANPDTGAVGFSLTIGLIALAGAAVVVSRKRK